MLMAWSNDEYYTVSVALTTLGAWRTGFYRIAWGGIGHLHVVTTFCRNQQKQNRHNFIHYLKKPCQLLTCNWWIQYLLWLLHIFFFTLITIFKMHFTVKYQYILNTLKLLIYLKYDVTPFPYQLIHVFCQTVTSIQDVQNQNDKMSAHFFFRIS